MKRKAEENAADHTDERSTMLVAERRQHILSVIQEQGRGVVGDISKSLGISLITIRKDLEYLQSRGLIERTHGGALPLRGGALADPTLAEKGHLHKEEKLRIAAAALDLIQEGECILLDSGTTTTGLARLLHKFKSLTIITNAVNIATELAGSDFEIILTGGILRSKSFSLVGPIAEDVLTEMHADILFLGVDGFDVHSGPTTPNVAESRVNKLMVKAAKRTVVLCDSSKFSRKSLARIVPTSDVNMVITDRNLSPEIAQQLRGMNVEVKLV